MRVINKTELPSRMRKSKHDDLIMKAISEWDPGKAVEITEKVSFGGLSARLRKLIKTEQVTNDVYFSLRQGRIFLVGK